MKMKHTKNDSEFADYIERLGNAVVNRDLQMLEAALASMETLSDEQLVNVWSQLAEGATKNADKQGILMLFHKHYTNRLLKAISSGLPPSPNLTDELQASLFAEIDAATPADFDNEEGPDSLYTRTHCFNINDAAKQLMDAYDAAKLRSCPPLDDFLPAIKEAATVSPNATLGVLNKADELPDYAYEMLLAALRKMVRDGLIGDDVRAAAEKHANERFGITNEIPLHERWPEAFGLK